MRIVYQLSAMVCATLVVSACSAEYPELLVPPMHSSAGLQREVRPESDPVLLSLCKASPSASKVFMDEAGQYHVSLLTSASSPDSSRAAEWAYAELRRASIRNTANEVPVVVVERDGSSRHSLCELLDYSSQVASLVLADSSFSTFGINELVGQVEIGLTTEEGIERIRSHLSRTEVPRSSYKIARKDPPIPTAVGWNAYFRHRPVVGGVAIGPSGCTSGIVGQLPGGQVAMFTAAHCSQVQGAIDGGAWSQPIGAASFGAEVHDYEWSCWIGGYIRRCDHADFAAFSLTGIDLLAGETAYESGVVYRRVDRVAGPAGVGSAEIDTVYPRLVVTNMQEYPVMNQVVDKIGKETGWSYGSIYDTCTTVAFGGNSSNKMYCQDFAYVNAQGGDSGSPVFVHYPNIAPSPGGNGITFMGILWAKASTGGGVFSSVRQMRNEVGNFCFFFC